MGKDEGLTEDGWYRGGGGGYLSVLSGYGWLWVVEGWVGTMVELGGLLDLETLRG